MPEAILLPGFFSNISKYIWKWRKKLSFEGEKSGTKFIGPGNCLDMGNEEQSTKFHFEASGFAE